MARVTQEFRFKAPPSGAFDGTDAQWQRLPAYARDTILRLHSDAESLRSTVATMSNAGDPDGETNTDVWLMDYLRGDRPLPPGSRIRFRVGHGRRDYVDARVTNGTGRRAVDHPVLELMANDSYLTIRAYSGNVVLVTVED